MESNGKCETPETGGDEAVDFSRIASGIREEEQESGGTPRTDFGRPKIQWIALGVFSHLIWGLYPVAARYLQVARGLPGLLLLGGSNFVALFVVQSFTCVGFGGRGGLRIGAGYSCLVFGRGASNMLSASFTSSIYIGIVTALAPFVVAGLSWMTLREEVPKCLLPALLTSSLGTVVAVVGQSGWDGAGPSSDDLIGIAMAFVSIIVSGGMRIFMKMSSSALSGFMLVSWQYMSALPLVIMSMGSMNNHTVQRLASITLADIEAMLTFVIVFTILSSVTQVTAVRHIGPTMDGSLQPLRLISTMCGGYVVLGESVDSVVGWIGLAIIFVTLMVYIYAQPRQDAVRRAKQCTGDATIYGRVISKSEA